MDCKAITTLRFLELVEKNGDHTQRSIAKNLDISLGNANALVKGLVDTGFIEVRENSQNRVQYFITPEGGSERVRLAYEYMNFSVAFCCDIKARIMRTFNALCQQNIRSVVFYGAGELAVLAFDLIQQTPLELRAVVDSNLAGKTFFTETVVAPSKLASLSFDKLFITDLINGMTLECISKELTIAIEDLVTLD